LLPDGVFVEGPGEIQRFQPTPPPTDAEVGVVPATISARVRRLLRRRGLDTEASITPSDPVAEDSPAPAGISSASIQGRVALGRVAGNASFRLSQGELIAIEQDARWRFRSRPLRASRTRARI
jgi:hypothetical protein